MLEKCNHKRLFLKDAKFYKVNLNCRTNISDGQFMPEEIKELYKSQGYSAVAFSDKDRMLAHTELTDENFVALTAFEFTITEECGNETSLNAIALNPDLKELPCITKENGEPFDLKAPMNNDEIRELIKAYKEHGFFIVCNHPRKSQAKCGKGTPYEEVDAIEIINYSSLCEGINEYNENFYEDVLKSGVRPFCIAADGNKNDFPFGYRNCDSCGAYVMIQAEELSYEAIADALKNGRFYSTEGPQIYDMWYRSEVLYIRCSPVDKIIFESGTRREIHFAENGKLLNGQGIYFWVMPEHSYARVTIIDEKGKKAFSNAYSSNDLFYTYEKIQEGTL